MSDQTRAAIINNLSWFLASLFIASIVWFVAKTEADPIEQRLFTRPISVLVDESMIITERSSETARVFVNAPRSTLAILQQDDVIVSADVRERPAGVYTIPLEVDIARLASADTQPSQITIEIEQRVSQQVPVEVDVTPPPVNYVADTPQRDVFQAVVSGTGDDVARVSRVVGELDLSEQTGATTIERNLSLVAEDANGDRVNEVTIEPSNLLVSVTVRERDDVRTFAVRPNILFNTLPDNFEFRNVSYEPNTVIINGSPEVLADLGDTIDTAPISLEGRTTDFSVDVGLELPEDMGLIVLSETSTVTVQIGISEVTSTVPLELVPVRLIGVSDPDAGLVTVNPVNVSVVLSGPVSLVSDITSDDVQIVVDVSGLAPGTHLVTPQIDILQGAVNLSSEDITLIPAQVNVTISEPQPEATIEAELTPEADGSSGD